MRAGGLVHLDVKQTWMSSRLADSELNYVQPTAANSMGKVDYTVKEPNTKDQKK